MADFKTIKDLINQEVVTNGQGLIDAVLLRGILIGMLNAVDANLFITAYDYANHRVTLSDGTHSQVYQLTPYVPVPDYYIGWTTGNKASFNALSDEQLAEIAGAGKYKTQTPYTRAFGSDSIFFLLYRSSAMPVSIVFTSNNTPMQQDIVEDNSFGDHDDVTIDGTTYKMFGIYMVGNDPNDSITINF